MRLRDKVAIITGGSRGIGFATADKFLSEGAVVIITASSQESVDQAVEKLREKYPEATVAGISPNLASLKSVREMFKRATEIWLCGHPGKQRRCFREYSIYGVYGDVGVLSL